MRLVSYAHDGLRRIGEVRGDLVVPLDLDATAASMTPDRLAGATRSTEPVPLRQVTLLPVVPDPAKVFCVGLNYRSHVDETARDLPTYPVLFPKWASALLGADDPLDLPPESGQVDWEGELAVVIGRPGRRIAEEHALDHVAGYTVANDVTMRDYQYRTHQWLQGKAWDRSTPVGPVLATPDEVDLAGAGIRTTLNGELVQSSDLGKLIFPVPTLIATISTFVALRPGDLILTGTPSGVGYRRSPQRFLAPGDTVVVEIDGIGRLTTRVDRATAGARDHPTVGSPSTSRTAPV